MLFFSRFLSPNNEFRFQRNRRQITFIIFSNGILNVTVFQLIEDSFCDIGVLFLGQFAPCILITVDRYFKFLFYTNS